MVDKYHKPVDKGHDAGLTQGADKDFGTKRDADIGTTGGSKKDRGIKTDRDFERGAEARDVGRKSRAIADMEA